MRAVPPLSIGIAAVVLSALLGGLFGGQVLATQADLPEHYGRFATALALVETHYVDEVDTERLIYQAIGGMLQTLDPHSSFMDPRSYAQLRERQEGRYYGLGISINVIDGDITVMSIFEGSPAYRSGLRRGDVIARITGQNAKDMTSDDAVRLLRGPKGTAVDISIRRTGYDELIDLTVERDEITIATIQAAFVVDGGTGYVKLGDFSETTDRDLGRALRRLRDDGMQRLILDLRNNPGGPLDQAIKVSNQFLPRGNLIVYTRGRVENSDQDYHASADGEFTDIPLVVIVNRNSASASEIVAGAIQDHDRGLVVGETTFGKALVQSIYRVSHGAGLALTTARYYTPSGRMIQRPWDGTFDEYLTYSMREQGPRAHSPAERKFTAGGREVYSGGGIEPDHRIAGPIEGFDPSRLGRLLAARQEFASYAERFSAEGDRRIAGVSRGRKLVSRGFVIDDAMLEEFKEHVRSRGLTVDDDAFAEDLDFIRAMMRYAIDEALFNVEEARRNLFGADPQTQLAGSLFAEAALLLEGARRPPVVARR
ncbi:MAG: S41 family peptidase [Acidobacteria bacterium]|nr:S41 family peptidase [Acidobacteriota bacterium]